MAINLGRDDGVEASMRFAVLAERPIEFRDPETGHLLGTHDLPKVLVEATMVHDHFTVCRTYRFSTVGGGLDLGMAATIRSWSGPLKRVYETLDAAKESFPAPLSQEESYVQIGDRVEQLRSEENDEGD